MLHASTNVFTIGKEATATPSGSKAAGDHHLLLSLLDNNTAWDLVWVWMVSHRSSQTWWLNQFERRALLTIAMPANFGVLRRMQRPSHTRYEAIVLVEIQIQLCTESLLLVKHLAVEG